MIISENDNTAVGSKTTVSTTMTELSWIDFDELYSKLINNIYNSGFQPNFIIGIPRGGLPLAVCLSHYFDAPLKFEIEDSWKYNKSKILIVDDISDNGDTLLSHLAMFYNKGFNPENIKTAVLVERDTTKYNTDFKAAIVTKEDGWIVFPWE